MSVAANAVRDPAKQVPGLDLDGGEEPLRKTWTRDEFHRMFSAGVLGPESRLELIEGEIFEMSPMDPRHANNVQRVRQALERIFGEGFLISEQLPLDLGESSEPYPDLAVSRGTLDDFEDRHPDTAVLVVEVSDSTLRHDRKRKASLYARAGLPEYWITDLVNHRLEVRRNPAPATGEPYGHGYDAPALFHPGESLSPLAAPDAHVAVSDLLPRSPKKANP